MAIDRNVGWLGENLERVAVGRNEVATVVNGGDSVCGDADLTNVGEDVTARTAAVAMGGLFSPSETVALSPGSASSGRSRCP